MEKFNIYVLEDKFWFRGSIIKKMEWGMPVDLTLVRRQLWFPNFVQVLDYTSFKGVDHCLK